MNNPSVPRCLALATLVKSCGSQPHDGFGGWTFFFLQVSVAASGLRAGPGVHTIHIGVTWRPTLQTGSTQAFSARVSVLKTA